MKSNKLSAYLSDSWWKLLLIALAVVMFWLLMMQVVAKPAPNERLAITFAGSDFQAYACREDLRGALPARTDQQLRSVTVNSIEDPEDSHSAMLLTVRTLGDTDLLIYEEKYAKDIPSHFEPLAESVIALFPGTELFCVDEKAYGFYVPQQSRLFSYYGGEERLVVFISSKCENLAALNGIGREEDDCALAALTYFFEVTA